MAVARLSLPKLPGAALLAGIASGPLGRLFAPLAPLMVRLGIQDRSNIFVLNIGDEGATLVQVRGGAVVDAVFAEATADEGWDALREMLQTDARAQIVLVADVLEQMFREDTVPKVGIFDRGTIVKRRLDLTFPNDLLKAALRLPRLRGQPQAVLFTALPMSAHLERWVSFLDEFPNPLRGFYMLPLEAVGLAGRLAPPLQGETRRVWRALITQEAASGFRQVFESGGKLTVTRLTQRASEPLTPEAEAMLIERELRSSISYVKRLGFSDADRLDVVIMADPAVCRAVDERDLPATTVTAFTPYQAGVMLGLGETGREDTPVADVLLGLWIAKKRRPTLTLPSPRIRRQMMMTSIIRASAAAAAVLTLLAAYYVGSLLSDFLSSNDEIASLQQKLQSTQADLDTELERVKTYPIPLDELTQVAEAEQQLAANEVNIPDIARKISKALAAEGRASSVSFELLKAPPAPTPKPGAKPVAVATASGLRRAIVTPYEIHLVVRLSEQPTQGTDNSDAVQRAKAILTRLNDAFPGYAVQATKLPSGLMVNQVLEGSSAGGQAKTGTAIIPTAEYVIRKEA